MCGICGWIYKDKEYRLSARLLKEASGRMRHRGLDAEGTYLSPGLGLAMRRLSIIDLQSGKQPMQAADKRYTIVYNGECYNHQELRNELEELGHSFQTNCDTEVVLKGYLEWREGVLQRLNGMFAFAVYDKCEHTLFVARDRLGIKPFYYYHENECLAFASEIKCLFADPKILCQPDLQAISDYLTFKYVPVPRTGFKNIYKLPPGCYAIYCRGELKIKEYWDVDFSLPGLDDLDVAEELIANELEKSVANRLMSDVPLGVMLSGGVDSSMVLANAARHKERISTFNIGFSVAEYDESPYATRVAQHFNSKHYQQEVAADNIAELGFLVRHLEEPLADSSALPLLALCRMTRSKVTVALAGDGGDELAAGYPRYYWEQRCRGLQTIPGFGTIARRGGQLLQKFQLTREAGRRSEKLAKTINLPQAQRYTLWHTCFTQQEKRNLLSPDFLKNCAIPEIADALQPFFRKVEHLDPVTRLQYVDLKTFLVNDLLLKADKMSMAVSLELRVPFLDHNLVNAMFRIPPKLHLAGGELKSLLKRVGLRDLPRDVIYRKKQGFSVPLNNWFAGGINSCAGQLLGEKSLINDGLFNFSAVRQLLDQARQGRTDVGHKLYALMYLQMWWKEFFS